MQSIQSLFAVTEIELLYKNKIDFNDRPKVSDPKSAFDIFQDAWDRNKIEMMEQCMLLLLDRRNSCLGISNISTGGISDCIVDPKVIFATALKSRASGIILPHNHPTGDLKPSEQDIRLTNSL